MPEQRIPRPRPPRQRAVKVTDPRPGDATAIKAQALEAQYAAEKAAREPITTSRSRTAPVEVYDDQEIVDYSGADVPIEVQEDDVDVNEPYREILVKFDIDQMSFGRIILDPPEYNELGELTKPAILGGVRTMDFKEGRRYKVPRALADHLDERGYVYHARLPIRHQKTSSRGCHARAMRRGGLTSLDK